MLAIFENNLALFKEFLLQFVDQDFQHICLQVFKVLNVQELALEPLFVLILVLDQAIVELFLDVREDVQKLIKVVLGHHTNSRVVFGLNRGRSFRACEQGNLAKMLSWAESSYESFLTVLVFDETFTFTFSNDKEIIGGFSLLDLDLFGLTHDELNFDNYIIFHL